MFVHNQVGASQGMPPAWAAGYTSAASEGAGQKQQGGRAQNLPPQGGRDVGPPYAGGRWFKIWFRRNTTAPSGGLRSSRCASAQSRLPSRLPGPGCAVIRRWIALVLTTSPSRFRWIGPRSRARIVQLLDR